ncbi:MAG: hypothetical protein FOGNACKC_06171 [Anaerolineae bacterium]|nr:hypothetical protein [Anaerolineae bacterium]
MPTKLDYVQGKKLNPADDLRETLALLEERQAKLKHLSADEALALLHELDRVAELLAALQAHGVDLLPEQARFETVQRQLKQRASVWLKTVGGPARLAGQRAQPVDDTRWWWALDGLVAANKKRVRRQIGLAGLALALVVAVVIVLFKTVLAPSPEVLARLDAENNAMQAFTADDVPGALASVEQGLAVAVDDPRLLILQGIFQDLLARPPAAQQSFVRAQAVLNNPESFYLLRAQLYLTTDQPNPAEADARAALAVNDNSARGWLLLGQALEAQDRREEALTAYNRAADLAITSGDDEVVVISRLAIGRMSGAIP